MISFYGPTFIQAVGKYLQRYSMYVLYGIILCTVSDSFDRSILVLMIFLDQLTG